MHTSGVLCANAQLTRFILAGREYVSICKNRALCDNFFKLCMVLGMDTKFQKPPHTSWGIPLVAVMHKIQDGRQWKLKRQYIGSY